MFPGRRRLVSELAFEFDGLAVVYSLLATAPETGGVNDVREMFRFNTSVCSLVNQGECPVSPFLVSEKVG